MLSGANWLPSDWINVGVHKLCIVLIILIGRPTLPAVTVNSILGRNANGWNGTSY